MLWIVLSSHDTVLVQPELPDLQITPPPEGRAVVASVNSMDTIRLDEVPQLLRSAGAPEEWVEPLARIEACENPNHRPSAKGDSGNSIGLWQLWYGWAGPDEDLTDPLTNARVAVRVRRIRGRFGGAGGWTCADLLGIP